MVLLFDKKGFSGFLEMFVLHNSIRRVSVIYFFIRFFQGFSNFYPVSYADSGLNWLDVFRGDYMIPIGWDEILFRFARIPVSQEIKTP